MLEINFLLPNFPKQSYMNQYVRTSITKVFRRHYELVSEFKVGLKVLLVQGLSDTEYKYLGKML